MVAMSDLPASLNPPGDEQAKNDELVGEDIRRAVEKALADVRQVQMAAAGRAAAQRAEMAGARYSSRTVDAESGSLGRGSGDAQPAVLLLGQAIHDISDQELLVVRHEEELLEYVASAVPSPGFPASAPGSSTTAGDVTLETPVVAELQGDDDLPLGEESTWRRLAIMVGLALLTCIGLLAFLIAP
jgi:hypothetical protein